MGRSIRKFSQTVNFSRLPFRRLRNHRYFPMAVVIAAGLFFACLHIWQRVQVMTLVHQTALLRERNHDLNQIMHKLDDDIIALSMASRIERYATDTLGLQRTPVNRLITIIDDRHEHVPTSELAQLFGSVQRVFDHFPVIGETEALAGEGPVLLLPEPVEEDEE